MTTEDFGRINGPVFPDACGHGGYVGSFECITSIKEGMRKYDLYVIPRSQEICIRYGVEHKHYISPGKLTEFLMNCQASEVKRRAALLLLDDGKVVWIRRN